MTQLRNYKHIYNSLNSVHHIITTPKPKTEHLQINYFLVCLLLV